MPASLPPNAETFLITAAAGAVAILIASVIKWAAHDWYRYITSAAAKEDAVFVFSSLLAAGAYARAVAELSIPRLVPLLIAVALALAIGFGVQLSAHYRPRRGRGRGHQHIQFGYNTSGPWGFTKNGITHAIQAV